MAIDASFEAPELEATDCQIQFKLPNYSFGVSIPPFSFPPFEIPIPRLRLALSCDLSKPIDISASVASGGGRVPNGDPSPDADDSF